MGGVTLAFGRRHPPFEHVPRRLCLPADTSLVDQFGLDVVEGALGCVECVPQFGDGGLDRLEFASSGPFGCRLSLADTRRLCLTLDGGEFVAPSVRTTEEKDRGSIPVTGRCRRRDPGTELVVVVERAPHGVKGRGGEPPKAEDAMQWAWRLDAWRLGETGPRHLEGEVHRG